jgi:hypothetical protein
MLDRKKCNQLINKANTLCKAPILDRKEILQAEKKLEVILPNDFKYINSLYNYEYIGFFDFYSFSFGVIEETLYYRTHYNLDNNYLVLSSDGSDFLLVNTKSLSESKVIWCSYNDFFNLCDGKPMEYNPTIFESFTDFFEYLVDEEDKMQSEDVLLHKINN